LATRNSTPWEDEVTVSNQDLKTAEARFREARAMISINILRRRMEASVLLVKALGGGWDVASLNASSVRG
jgi:outer membrane protein TolC